MIFWFFIFVVLIFIFWLIYRAFKIKNLGVIFASAHFVFIFIIGVLVYIHREEAQVEFFWFIPMQFDMPITFLFSIVIPIIDQLLGNAWLAGKVFAPFIFFAMFGSFQYYFIGRLISFVISKLSKKLKTTDITVSRK